MPKRRRSLPLPRLTRTTLRDPSLHWAANEAIGADPELRRLAMRIRKLQEKLRHAVDDDAWSLYLKLEQTINQRVVDESAKLVAWAFREGLREGTRSG